MSHEAYRDLNNGADVKVELTRDRRNEKRGWVRKNKFALYVYLAYLWRIIQKQDEKAFYKNYLPNGFQKAGW